MSNLYKAHSAGAWVTADTIRAASCMRGKLQSFLYLHAREVCALWRVSATCDPLGWLDNMDLPPQCQCLPVPCIKSVCEVWTTFYHALFIVNTCKLYVKNITLHVKTWAMDTIPFKALQSLFMCLAGIPGDFLYIYLDSHSCIVAILDLVYTVSTLNA